MPSKNIPDPGFPKDDGSPDPALTAALQAWQADADTEAELLPVLAGARLLVPVVALLDEVETGPDGLRREKSSDMAVPTLTAPDGRRALPVFTSLHSLARWQEDARPVAVGLAQALSAAAQEQADALIVDPAGPVPYELAGAALRSLARLGTDVVDPLADPVVTSLLRSLVAAEPAVRAAHLVTGGSGTDGTVVLAVGSEQGVREAVQGLAQTLATHDELRTRLVRGLELAVLPPESALPGTPLFSR